MACHEEAFVEKRTEGSVFFRIWKPDVLPRAVICLIHGLGDHSGCFLHFAEYFTEAGYAVAAVDLYGNGRSEGERGDVPAYPVFLNEVDALLEKARALFPGRPLFLYGHSMGGGIVLHFALRRRPAVSGVVASAPWLEMVNQPKRRVFFAGFAALFAPLHRFDSGLHPEKLSHDPAFGHAYLSDPFVHGLVSARLFHQASLAGKWTLSHAPGTQLPTLLVHGEADAITSASASRRYAAHSNGHAEYCGFSGAFHTLHNERNKEEIFHAVDEWMERVVGRTASAVG